MDLMRARHRLSKLLLRHGIRFDDGDAWTERHRQWLATVDAGLAGRAGDVARRPRRDRRARAPPRALEREIVAMLPSSPWTVQVGRLRCLRGIDTLTAVGLCAEIGDFERFARAEQLMSYLGLVPCESTTGQQRRLGSITKTGSGHARRLLVEAAWHYRPRPRIGTALADRQDDQPPEAIAIAWSAPTTAAPHLDPPRAARQAPHDHRGRRRPRTRRLLLGDHPNRVTQPDDTSPSRRLGRWRPGNARGTRDPTMSNPPPTGLATPDTRQRLPTTNHGPAAPTRAYQSDRASRTACRTATHPADHNHHDQPTQMREINDPDLTNASPYQSRRLHHRSSEQLKCGSQRLLSDSHGAATTVSLSRLIAIVGASPCS